MTDPHHAGSSEHAHLHETLHSPSAFHSNRLKGSFLLHPEDLFTNRGHTLPGLFPSHSSTSLHKLGLFPSPSSTSLHMMGQHYSGRRPSSLFDTDVEAADLEREERERERRQSAGALALMTPQMRSMRLIGNSNPRYQWEQYIKTKEELKTMKKPIRKYYERTNSLVQQYIYIDRLLDSSLPHSLIQEYQHNQVSIPGTIFEEPASPTDAKFTLNASGNGVIDGQPIPTVKLKRTPRNLYRLPDEQTPLLTDQTDADNADEQPIPVQTAVTPPGYDSSQDVESGDRIVTVAIYLNLLANAILLCAKISVTILTNSLSVLASLVDSALDFLSTGIVWTVARMIARSDNHAYPVGRRRLEPLGVLVFSIIMITAFFQVMLECFQRLMGADHSIVELTPSAIFIMGSTVIIKFAIWLWCRLIKNSSVQALAQDAMTDVVFNTFSIIFPLGKHQLLPGAAPKTTSPRLTNPPSAGPVGYYLQIWYLDPLGGLLLSLYIITNWSLTSASHIRNLTGAAATADERNVLLYLTMRFARTIKQIQSLQAYHAGDKLIVEVDIVLDEEMSLRDSHDLGESLQYVLESVPTVDRAFVHQDYAGYNIPNHMQQQG